MPQKRPPLYLLTGLTLGIIVGLFLSWVAFPARPDGIAPAGLTTELREQYRVMVALAFASSGDLGRAQARLTQLGGGDSARQLNSQAQLALLDQDSQREARALDQLAQALKGEEQIGEFVDLSNAPILLAEAVYSITEQQLLCDAGDGPKLKLFFLDADGLQEAGLELRLLYEGSPQESYTGLHPELGPGHAEFDLTEDQEYELNVQGEKTLIEIHPVRCEGGWGTWLLTLRRN
ncbi:MAG: hypothetical protein O3B43_00455 [Chloroflexi bacterium]|nr:hypothetical protein [Chloroflexota bacterium]